MQTTLVSGASSGVGRGVARRLARMGHPVIAVARRRELLDSLVVEINDAGGRAHSQPCDVTDPGAVRHAVQEGEATLGPIQRLVAIAGGGHKTPARDFRASDFESIFRVNVMGTVNCIEAVLPAMLERRCGHIVTMGSLAAVHNLSESLRLELRGTGIDVTLVTPGFIRTKPHKARKPFQVELERAAERICRAILLRRPYCAFPMPLAFASGVARCLPHPVYGWLARSLWRGRKG